MRPKKYYNVITSYNHKTMGKILATKDKLIQVRVEGSLKNEVEAILKQLGLTTSEAVYLFLNKVKLVRGLPFEVKIPNQETIETFEKTDRGEDLHHYDSIGAAKDAAKNW